jgi:hypothetical protein
MLLVPAFYAVHGVRAVAWALTVARSEDRLWTRNARLSEPPRWRLGPSKEQRHSSAQTMMTLGLCRLGTLTGRVGTGRFSSTRGEVTGSPVNAMPRASRAATTFASIDVLPLGIPSDASKRWSVRRLIFDISASSAAEMPSKPRAARSWDPDTIDILRLNCHILRLKLLALRRILRMWVIASLLWLLIPGFLLVKNWQQIGPPSAECADFAKQSPVRSRNRALTEHEMTCVEEAIGPD